MPQYDPARAQAAAQRVEARAHKERQRALDAQEKERKRRYVEGRSAKVDAENKDLDRQVQALENLLGAALRVDAWVDLESLKKPLAVRPFDAGNLGVVEALPSREDFVPPALSGVKKLVPGAKAKHAAAVADGERLYEEAVDQRDQRETRRQAEVKAARANYEAQAAAAVAERGPAQRGDRQAAGRI
jgi:restriction system protein